MSSGLRVALLSVVFCGVAVARPVTVEETATFGTPNPTYEGFAQRVAVDGDYAIATASHFIPDPGGDPAAAQNFLTAFLFQHTAKGWRTVRQLLQYLDKPAFPIPLGVAMRNGIAAVQTVNTDIWELTATGWVRSAAQLSQEAPGPYLGIEAGDIINGEGAGRWSANVCEKDALGTAADSTSPVPGPSSIRPTVRRT